MLVKEYKEHEPYRIQEQGTGFETDSKLKMITGGTETGGGRYKF